MLHYNLYHHPERVQSTPIFTKPPVSRASSSVVRFMMNSISSLTSLIGLAPLCQVGGNGAVICTREIAGGCSGTLGTGEVSVPLVQ